MPVTYGGVIVVGSFLGWLFLKESIAPLQLAGIALITVGVGCVVASKL
jgi:drug/metabolite transporter (DMT)-like permease